MVKNMSRDYFDTNYKKEFDKLWSDHVKKLSGLESPLKQTAVITKIQDTSMQTQAEPMSSILITLKTQACHMLERKPLNFTSKSILDFLNRSEISFCVTFMEASPEDESILEKNVRGFDNLSFDWSLCLITFYPSIVTSEVQEKFISLWGGLISNAQNRNFISRNLPQ